MQPSRDENLKKLTVSTSYLALKHLGLDKFCQDLHLFNHLDSTVPSNDERYKNSLIEFAHADESGATFAVWVLDDVDIEACPVLYHGDNLKIIARCFKDFLILVSLDCNFGSSIYRDCESYEESPNHALYCKWLKREMGLTPIANCLHTDGEEVQQQAEQIISEAEVQYQLIFDTWFYNLNHNTSLTNDEYKEQFGFPDKAKSVISDEKITIELAEYHQGQNDSKAFDYYKNIYSNDPSNDETFTPLAEYYEAEGSHELALEFYIKSIVANRSHDCDEDKRHNAISEICNTLNKDAIAVFNSILEQASDDFYSNKILAKHYYELGEYMRGFEYFKMGFNQNHDDYAEWKKKFAMAGVFKSK